MRQGQAAVVRDHHRRQPVFPRVMCKTKFTPMMAEGSRSWEHVGGGSDDDDRAGLFVMGLSGGNRHGADHSTGLLPLVVKFG